MPTLHKSDYATVEHAVASRLVRIVRSGTQFEHAVAAKSEVAKWSASLEQLEVKALGLLLDWRSAPRATDPDMLKALVSGTNALGLRFARHALLLTTPVGALQSQRLQRVHNSHPEIFMDESKAYEYVMGL